MSTLFPKRSVPLVMFALVLIIPKCFSVPENQKEEDFFDIDLNADESKEIFDPFDLLNYDRHKMLKGTKMKAGREIENDISDPFDPLNLNMKQANVKNLNSVRSDQLTQDNARNVMDGLTEKSEENVHQSKEKPEVEVSVLPSSRIDCKCEAEVQKCEEDPIVARERPILRRFIQSLYSTLLLENVNLKDGDVLHFLLSAKITQRAHGILHDIVSTEGDIKKKKLADLDEVLYELLKLETSQDRSITLSIVEFINSINMHPKDWLPLLFFIYLVIIIIMLHQQRSIFVIFSTSIILFIGVSWYWNWHHLYQQSLSKRQSDALKYSEMPASCKPRQLSSFEAAFVWFSNLLPGEDPCEKYHEILMTDPIYQVTPIMALSDSLATAIFHPLGYIGQQIGLFFTGVLDASNWYAKIPILMVVVFLIVVMLVLGCGYEIHMPLWMGSLKPAQHQEPRISDLINAPQVEAVTSPPERGLGTSQPIMVVVKVVTDALGDSKVQKISELTVDSSSSALPINIQDLPDATRELEPIVDCHSNTRNCTDNFEDVRLKSNDEVEQEDSVVNIVKDKCEHREQVFDERVSEDLQSNC